MKLSKNPTQTELRAWSIARQELGPELFDQLSQPTSVTSRLGRVVSSALRGRRMVETRSTRLEPSATRRGGSPTRGRKAQPAHNPQPNGGTVDGDVSPSMPTIHRSKAKNATAPGLFALLLSSRDPGIIVGLGIVVVLFVLAVFA